VSDSLIDDLIDQYGLGGLLSVDSYSLGEGPDDWRYVVTIDGEARSDLEVKTTPAAVTVVDDLGRELEVWSGSLTNTQRVLRRLRELMG
jgi:hypothetical protein